MRLTHWITAGALALASVTATLPAPAFAQETHLSQCMRNGLIGAGVGALVGAAASNHHRGRNAVIGAAVGGVGTWGVCRILSHREQARVESDYQRSLSRNRSVSDSWSSDAGTRSLYVSRPQHAENGCRSVTAHINDGQNGRQDLPPETFCRNDAGQWVPAA
ncbi:MAG: YMGG-like glycine zipper-containing protein [Terricaulis silvestris]